MCDCGPEHKRTYYANIQLFTEMHDGIVSGGGSPMSVKEVIVCAGCWRVEFSIPDNERRWFGAA